MLENEENMFNQVALVQLGEYIWQNDFVRLTGKRATHKSMKKIKIGRAVFIKKDSIPKKFRDIIDHCYDLTNLYPIGAFLELVGTDRYYNSTLKRQGKELKIEKVLAYDLKMILLTDELINLSKEYFNIFLVNSKRCLEDDMKSTFLGKNEFGFY